MLVSLSFFVLSVTDGFSKPRLLRQDYFARKPTFLYTFLRVRSAR